MEPNEEMTTFRQQQAPMNEAFDDGCRVLLRQMFKTAVDLAAKQAERSASSLRNPHHTATQAVLHKRDVAFHARLLEVLTAR